MAPSIPRVWLITGSSSGFGRAMVEEVLRNGEIAVATLRKPSVLDGLAAQYPRTQLLILPLDVTNEAQVKSVFVQAKDAFGHVDVVYNNAGQVLYQEVEGMPLDRAKALMDVNFWGAVTVSFEAIRFFREANPKGAGGVLVQVSSMTATTAIPLVGFYNCTKAALDSFTEVLAQEVLPAWNIRFVNVHPGWTRTPISSSEMLEPPAVYASEPAAVTTKMRAGFDAFIGSDALAAVEVVTKRIWSVTRMDDEDLRKGMQEGIPGLVNVHTGMDSLGFVQAKIGRLQGELMWNTKVHYEY
ncbi:NAD(P)-binding protein [Suillus clintonianus]|uniref:NAD(P)-binding protein n=1 Tax=Suillus clintonianus TaxID=1904413 RepID=UPI001B879884|nr:NAD(P)-binding protein [Suillus clintonianus]KAG2140986.1 NAD(P)-binding protein [Suillus clintonianus]